MASTVWLADSDTLVVWLIVPDILSDRLDVPGAVIEGVAVTDSDTT
jgi:hypothetical protein